MGCATTLNLSSLSTILEVQIKNSLGQTVGSFFTHMLGNREAVNQERHFECGKQGEEEDWAERGNGERIQTCTQCLVCEKQK